MSIYQVKPKEDPLIRERRETERRRQRYQERAKRILNPKVRTIGIDTNALAQQVSERQQRERVEMERGQYFDTLSNQYAQTLTEHDRVRSLEKRREAQELEQFRSQQAKEKRARDLARESGIENAVDFDSKVLAFSGEDNGYRTRKKAQQAQLKDWLAQQIEMLRFKESSELKDRVAYDAMQKKINDMKNELEQKAVEQRRIEARQFVQANRLMAEDKRAETRRIQQMNQQMNDMEIQHTINSDFMTEKVNPRVLPGVRTSATGAIPYHFKGFSTDRRQHIVNVQQRQMDDLKSKRSRERQASETYEQEQARVRRTMVLQEREKQRQLKAARQNLQLERKTQAKEQKQRTQYLDHVVYTNPVTDEFFNYFGQSCR